MVGEIDTNNAHKSRENPSIKIRLRRSEFNNRLSDYRVKVENTTDIGSYIQVRDEVGDLGTTVLKKLGSYKDYFELEISHSECYWVQIQAFSNKTNVFGIGASHTGNIQGRFKGSHWVYQQTQRCSWRVAYSNNVC